jgi:murein DD-endopeptidase MepM/ murein hydrolase activator NlpD
MVAKASKPAKKNQERRALGYKEETRSGRAVTIILGLCIICSTIAFYTLKSPIPTAIANHGRAAQRPGIDSAASNQKPNALPAMSEHAKLTDPSFSSGVSSADPSIPSALSPLAVNDSDLSYLRTKDLLIPVEGITASQLHDTFYSERSEGRIHQALDIMAPQGAPVLACAGGSVKLLTSARGGTMIYVIDPSGLFVYYYAHLQRYADGMSDGKQVSRGEVIGYVGDTGNAGPGNFHLHFGISKVTTPGKWSGGQPINPYPLLSEPKNRP